MKNIMESLKNLSESKVFSGFILGIGIMIIAILIFTAGTSFGDHRASFRCNWGENYGKNFGMMQKPMMFDQERGPNTHGAVGKIIKIELPTIVVQDKDNLEKIVLIKDDTKVQQMKETLSTNELKVNDFVVIIGNPNDQGQVEAKLIRLMPSPELMK